MYIRPESESCAKKVPHHADPDPVPQHLVKTQLYYRVLPLYCRLGICTIRSLQPSTGSDTLHYRLLYHPTGLDTSGQYIVLHTVVHNYLTGTVGDKTWCHVTTESSSIGHYICTNGNKKIYNVGLWTMILERKYRRRDGAASQDFGTIVSKDVQCPRMTKCHISILRTIESYFTNNSKTIFLRSHGIFLHFFSWTLTPYKVWISIDKTMSYKCNMF